MVKDEASLYRIETPEGTVIELPCFTCVHCQRIVVRHPSRTRPRNVCLKCDALTCDSAGCVVGCNSIMKDAEKAYKDLMNQPWMLRDDMGYPIYRIDGKEIRRDDAGYTDRELEAMANVSG